MKCVKFYTVLLLILTTTYEVLGKYPLLEIIQVLFEGAVNNQAVVSKFMADITKPPPFNEAIQIYCANPKTKTFTQTFINDSSINSKLDFTSETAFIIHGWIDNGNHQWLKDVAIEVLNNQNINVCRINWATLSVTGYAIAATQNTRIVANYITQFIAYLNTAGNVRPENITLVGHSLGAHISGFIGANFAGHIKKIFGLDPAGPLFTNPVVLPPKMRLDPTDAQQVIVIHSSDMVLGVTISCGHQDFYGNSGFFPQKGCFLAVFHSDYMIEPVSCSHYRAIDYFKRSLTPGCNYDAVKCDDRPNYFLRNCDFNVTNRIEWNVKKIPGRFYFATGDEPDATGRYW